MLLPFLHPILYIYIYIASIPIESISISILTVFDRYLFPFLSFLFFFSPLFSLSLSRVSSCITIISLQLSASSAGELHFCKDAPCTRWVNEPDVSSSCLLFLSLPPTTEVTLFSSFSLFFFLLLRRFFYVTTETSKKNGRWIGRRKRAEASHCEYREADDPIYRSAMHVLLQFHATRPRRYFALELDFGWWKNCDVHSLNGLCLRQQTVFVLGKLVPLRSLNLIEELAIWWKYLNCVAAFLLYSFCSKQTKTIAEFLLKNMILRYTDYLIGSYMGSQKYWTHHRNLLHPYLMCCIKHDISLIRGTRWDATVIIMLVKFKTNLKMYKEITRYLLQTYAHIVKY